MYPLVCYGVLSLPTELLIGSKKTPSLARKYSSGAQPEKMLWGLADFRNRLPESNSNTVPELSHGMG